MESERNPVGQTPYPSRLLLESKSPDVEQRKKVACARMIPEDEGARSHPIARIKAMADGSSKGSHRAFRHPAKPMVVTVPGNRNDDLPLGTLKSILRKAEIEES